MKSKKTMTAEVVPVPTPRKSKATIMLGESMKLPKLQANSKVTVTLIGKVTGWRDTDWDRSFDVELTKIEVDRGMGGDLADLKEDRREVS